MARKVRFLLNLNIGKEPSSFPFLIVKFFLNKKLTKVQLRQDICTFAKRVGVNRVIFNNNGKGVCGTYNSHKKNIYICLNQTKQQMLRTFFHELGHHEAVKKNKWTSFHFNLIDNIQVDILFNIENKIDQIGKKLWYKYVDTKQWGMYKYFYPKSHMKTYINSFDN